MYSVTYIEVDVPKFLRSSPDDPDETQTFRWCLPAHYLDRSIEAIDSITGISFTPARISLGQDLGQRASLSVTFKDHLHVFTDEPYNRGTFFGKWRGRYGVTLRGRPLRLIRGQAGQSIEQMDIRHYLIEATSGPTLDATYTIEAKDVLKFADDDRAQAPLLSNGSLAGSINVVATSLTLSPNDIGDYEYPTSGYVNIGGKEVCGFVRTGGDDANVLLLCHYDGTDGSTTAADFDSDSLFGAARVATRFGNVRIESDQFVFGATSAFFDGTGDAVTYPDSPDWTFGDFTIDARIRVTSLAAIRTIACQGTGANRWQFRVETTGALSFFENVASVSQVSLSSAISLIAINTWYHVAVTRSGSVFRLFIDGVQVATVTTVMTTTNFAAALAVGAQSDGATDPWIGYIDEIRISNIARWTEAFTLPTTAYRDGDLMDITRGQFGSVAQEHDSGDRVQLALRYDGDDVADIIYDLLVNYAAVPAEYITLSDWQTETADNLGVIYAATLTEPISVKTLISELIEQAALALYWDDRAQKIRLVVLREIATDTATFNEENIIDGSLRVQEQSLKRISRIWTFYGQRDPTDTAANEDNYRRADLQVDLAKEAEYGSAEIRKIQARWIETETAASRLNTLQISRFRDPPRSFAFDVHAGTTVTPAAGYTLEWWGNQDETGVTIPASIQITQVAVHADRIHIEAEEMLASGVVVLVNVVFLTSTNDSLMWQVPVSWNDADNSIHTIGAGAGGGGALQNSAGGGGGGAYSSETNVNLTPGDFVAYKIGEGGIGGDAGGNNGTDGEDTFFGAVTLGASIVGAKGGTGGQFNITAGAGGAAASGIGSVKNSGGAGGNGALKGETRSGGGGGGGAAGPNGDGGAGGTGADGGGGGGGADGGFPGDDASGVTGGNGGNNRFSFGGGNSTTTSGDEGGGGFGGTYNGATCGPGGAGEQIWTQTISPITSAGPGGGGGGGGSFAPGADGGIYGGGGSGGGLNSEGGGGEQGLVVIIWREA